MKDQHMWKNPSVLGWAGRAWWTTERKVVCTMRETMLLSASLLLVLLKVMKTAPPESDARTQHGPDAAPRT